MILKTQAVRMPLYLYIHVVKFIYNYKIFLSFEVVSTESSYCN